MYQVLAITLATATLTGCEAVKGIFKAGMWVGILGVVFVIAIIAAFAGMFKRA
jgi:hypothetical protein